jgi:hypothetical protein
MIYVESVDRLYNYYVLSVIQTCIYLIQLLVYIDSF